MRATALTIVAIALAASIAAPMTTPVNAAAGHAAAGRPRYCHGERATIVGTPTRNLRGTSGADVIVTHGAFNIDARGGDDLICVTGSRGSQFVVHDGPGDDLIDASRSLAGVAAGLGPGDDTFIGSPGSDTVHAVGQGTDHVSTGAGADYVEAGGTKGHADHDVVHLGPGDDEMPAGGRDGTTKFFGDSGSDLAMLPFDPVSGHAPSYDWVYDDVRHGTYRNGVRIRQWQGFERFLVDTRRLVLAHARSMTFLGGPTDEDVELDAFVRHGMRVNLGAGDDIARIMVPEQTGSTTPKYVITGGPGHNVFQPTGDYGYDELDNPTGYAPYIDVDLPDHTFATSHDGPPLGSVKGFEDVDAVRYWEADLTGDDQDNSLSALNSCTGHLTGAGGDDVLTDGLPDGRGVCNAADDPSQPTPGATLDGGPGDDTLTGGYGDDTLIGGPDTDSADGSVGFDTCSAETVVRCEA